MPNVSRNAHIHFFELTFWCANAQLIIFASAQRLLYGCAFVNRQARPSIINRQPLAAATCPASPLTPSGMSMSACSLAFSASQSASRVRGCGRAKRSLTADPGFRPDVHAATAAAAKTWIILNSLTFLKQDLLNLHIHT